MLTLPGLFADGRIVDFILALVAVEAVLVLAYRVWSGGKGVAPASFIANLTAGASLLLALRAALSHAHWNLVALWLLVGLLAHLVDLALRWRR